MNRRNEHNKPQVSEMLPHVLPIGKEGDVAARSRKKADAPSPEPHCPWT